MIATYKIGDKEIDVSNLLAIGEVKNIISGGFVIPLHYLGGILDVIIKPNEYGAPYYHKSKGDWTEEDSNFWSKNEREKLIEFWRVHKK